MTPSDKAARMLDALTGLTVGVAARAAIAQFLANVTTEQLAALYDATVTGESK
jgi:hypothetical protein